jgi:hypothetical protein
MSLSWFSCVEQEDPAMLESEHLPYIVDLWASDELSVRCLARAAERSIALMAFDAAAVSYPHQVITVRGPGLNEAHQPARPDDSRMALGRSGLNLRQGREVA